ncbi:NAD(P)H-dependent oxidoreductase [Streptomyces sp. H27-C3]|uniref:NAD(P)H-dependent oxidoreductase n=1 Tax=Streptomyces sp. H27-C3 TaxID=3046305 RepID=UPI0024B9CE18|nr:NAD(P)H-dependent oxidoreductase [Streptomyces sp. H27-C3]MDJ0466670.1 NAD(P)H-dependent oxidoreductase [Streptomyces sp. H27-C3]
MATLAREEFAPVEGHFKPQAEQMRAVKSGTLDAAVKAHLDRLLAADLLVLSFPMWWFSLPAVLKGWVDRVFVMGGRGLRRGLRDLRRRGARREASDAAVHHWRAQ